MSKIWIGEVYPSREMYADEANQTIGAPALTEEVILNRRRVTSKLNASGRKFLDQVKMWFEGELGTEVKLTFSKSCGCSMCPCSPGFKVIVEIVGCSVRTNEERRLRVWSDDGKGKKSTCLRPPSDESLVNEIKYITGRREKR